MVVPGVRAAAGKAVGKAVSSHAVVPGVRAAAGKAAGKAVSNQSSIGLIGLRILALALVDCTCYVLDDGARAVFLRFKTACVCSFSTAVQHILALSSLPNRPGTHALSLSDAPGEI